MIQTYESRYSTVEQFTDRLENLVLAERVPFRYEPRDDNIVHTSGEGDSWFHLAQQYYVDISNRACGLWWIICDFQPQPIVDPTIKLSPGQQIIIPAPSLVAAEILGVQPEEFL